MKPRIHLTSPLKALADPTRLKILLMLEAKPRTVGEIVNFFNLTQPTITRHLQALQKVGLVEREKKAQSVYYRLKVNSLRAFCVDLVSCFPCCCIELAPSNKNSERFEVKTTSAVKRSRDKDKPISRRGAKS